MHKLSPATAIDLLAEYGLAERVIGSPEVLAGGVSCVVVGAGDVVIKQALGKLDVEDDWFAPVQRMGDEAGALRIAGEVIPGRAPQLLHFDPERQIVVLERAPRDWDDLRARFLRGDIAPGIGAALGDLLGDWHTATARPDYLAQFADRSRFHALRVEPFYLTAAERVPAAAERIGRLVTEMDAVQVTLVHGDFSPKNILAGPLSGLWAIDFESTHAGDPAFDAAYMLNHVLLKSMHLPQHAAEFDEVANSFLAAYLQAVEPRIRPNPLHLMAHVAAQMLARTIGKSPASYLDQGERDRIRDLATELLLADTETLDQMLDARDRVIA